MPIFITPPRNFVQVKYPSRRRKNVSVSFPPKEKKTETRRSGSRFSASRSGNEVLRRGVSARAIRGLRAQLVVPDVHGLRDGRRARRLPSVKETIPHLGSRSLLSQQMTISLYESQPCGMCIWECVSVYEHARRWVVETRPDPAAAGSGYFVS